MEHEIERNQSSRECELTLSGGYCQMVNDLEQEAEAEEWTTALIGDSMETDE
jgi:hypothetical protein